jgi:hypothetical protein
LLGTLMVHLLCVLLLTITLPGKPFFFHHESGNASY